MTDRFKNLGPKPGGKRPIGPIAYGISLALTGSYPPAAFAQDATAVLEAVIVTARKREETLLAIPQEIQAISQKDLERANVSTLQDLQRFVPSLTHKSTTPGRGTIYFRGVADDSSSFIADSSAAVYFDEQPLTQSGMQPEVRLIDIERVEALPGPQGTLYGSSSQSGTLRYITNKPDAHGTHAAVTLDGHTVDHGDQGYELSGVLNLPVGKNAAIRLVGFSARDAGFIDNVFGDSLGQTFDNADVVEKDVNAVEYIGGRAALRWHAGENWMVDLSVIHQQLDANTYAEDNVLRAGRELAVVRFLDESRSDEWTQLALTLQGDLGWGELISATSYFTRDIDYLQDNTDYTFYISSFSEYLCAAEPPSENCPFDFGTDPAGLGLQNKDFSDRVAQEFRLQGTTGKTTWIAGLFYEYMDNGFEFFSRIRDYEDTPAFAYWITQGVQPGTTDNSDYSLKGKLVTDQIAVFGEVDYTPNERWGFTAGLRWFDHTRDRKHLTQQPNGRELFYDEGKTSTSDVTKKLSVQYNINENAMVYALFSDGFRAGGRNIAAPGVVLPADYDPDFLDNYELGFKSRWDGGRYEFNFTAFKMQWEDYQVEVVDPGALPEFFVVVVTNVGNAEIEGLSADFRAFLWDSLHLGLNVQVLDPRVTQGNALVGTRSGDRLPFAAEEKGAVWVEYTFPAEIAGGHVYGRFQWTYTGNMLNGVSRPRTLQTAYQVSDFKVGFESEDWQIYAYVDNLTNERAILFDRESALVPGTVSINSPRTWGLGFSKSWGGN